MCHVSIPDPIVLENRKTSRPPKDGMCFILIKTSPHRVNHICMNGHCPAITKKEAQKVTDGYTPKQENPFGRPFPSVFEQAAFV
jgi:hypothetical protein